MSVCVVFIYLKKVGVDLVGVELIEVDLVGVDLWEDAFCDTCPTPPAVSHLIITSLSPHSNSYKVYYAQLFLLGGPKRGKPE